MGFDINNFLNAESKKEVKSDWKPVKLSVHKLRPAAGKENFYHMDDKEIEETARTIELVGIQQYPVVKPIPGTDEYEIIAGHKRRLAMDHKQMETFVVNMYNAGYEDGKKTAGSRVKPSDIAVAISEIKGIGTKKAAEIMAAVNKLYEGGTKQC